jgi:hypothetical protein
VFANAVQKYGSGRLTRRFNPRIWTENTPGAARLSLTHHLASEMSQLTGLTDPRQLLERFFRDAAAYIRLHQEMFGNYHQGLMLKVLRMRTVPLMTMDNSRKIGKYMKKFLESVPGTGKMYDVLPEK